MSFLGKLLGVSVKTPPQFTLGVRQDKVNRELGKQMRGTAIRLNAVVANFHDRVEELNQLDRRSLELNYTNDEIRRNGHG